MREALAQESFLDKDPTPIHARLVDVKDISDGTIGASARASLQNGYLPASPDEARRKGELDGLSRMRATQKTNSSSKDLSALRRSQAINDASSSLVIDKQGLEPSRYTPSQTVGAAGLDRYIQLTNDDAAIYNKQSGQTIAVGKLNTLAGAPSTARSFRPQIIWDPSTNRFYYSMNTAYSETSNKVSFGFSKSSGPTNFARDWCHYSIDYKANFPDFPTLGDAASFLMIGVNTYDGSSNGAFLGSDLITIEKPTQMGSLRKCPPSLAMKIQKNIKDTNGNQIFSPVPANQVDHYPNGYVIARNGSLPSSDIWVIQVERLRKTWKTKIRALQYGSGTYREDYDMPPSAEQPLINQLIDTLDARFTQAVMSYSPSEKSDFLWTTQTIDGGSDPWYLNSDVRVLKINPKIVELDRSTPYLVDKSDFDGQDYEDFHFNAAVSTDRRVDGSIKMYGDNIAVTMNRSSRDNSINPELLVFVSDIWRIYPTQWWQRPGVGPYRDPTCIGSADLCSWGASADAAPDPRPANRSTGVIWITGQYSNRENAPIDKINWSTHFFALSP